MSRKQSIEAQLKRAEEIFFKIEEEYKKSLHNKKIGEELKLDIQTFVGHIKSALDYISKDIYEKYCNNQSQKKVYFPIIDDQAKFKKIMQESFPELDTNGKDVSNYIESIQPFNKDYLWLGQFNEVNNESKHNDLVEQKRTESKRVNIDINGGGSVNWNPSAVKFGSGVYIGGVPVNPNTQMPIQSESQTITIQTWVDFKFDDIDVSALTLLKQTLAGSKDIISHISSKIY